MCVDPSDAEGKPFDIRERPQHQFKTACTHDANINLNVQKCQFRASAIFER